MTTVVGVDVGGTFTDVVAYDGSTLKSWKTPTTTPQSAGVSEALEQFGSGGFLFLHGTTVATNALLEGTGARVILVTSAGFEDVLEISRQARPSLYDLSADRPVPLVTRADRIGHIEIAQTLELLKESNPESVAIGLLDSYRDPAAEQSLAEAIRLAQPGVPVSVASAVSPGFREYERLSTTVIDAYLAPSVSGYLRELNEGVASTSASVMTSSGGLLPFGAAESSVGTLTLSGPAAGVVAGDSLRQWHGIESVITFDMGGTSTDVSRIGSDGVVLAATQTIAGRTNRVPSMPIHTVGAGGGSIAWLDSGGALRVGPSSAGAHPGPAAYGFGGDEATVTDANLYLGYIPDQSGFSGGLTMSRSLAGDALSALGRRLGLAARETAEGILRVVDAHMDRAIRRVSIEEGFDTRQSSLVAFGGAGGLHASRLARGLGMRSVLIPPHAGAFSALGLLMSRPRVEQLRTVLAGSESPDVVDLAAAIAQETTQRFVDIHGERPVDVDLLVDARYEAQSHELTIPYRDGQVRNDFEQEHRGRFGFNLEDAEVEVVNIRGVAYGSAPLTWEAVDHEPSGEPRASTGSMWIDGAEIEADVWQRATLPLGFEVSGPAVVGEGTASVLLQRDDLMRVMQDGTLEITW